MDGFTALKGFWKSFTQLRKILLRNISVLALIMFPLTYQIIAVEFFVEEESSSACNYSGRCLHTTYEIVNGTRTKITKVTPYFQIDFVKYGTVLVTTHYISILLGALTLGIAADRYGRKKILFICLALLFIASLLGALFIRSMPVFIPIRLIAGFTLGGSLLTLFVLVAEYVNPGQRPFVLTIIWLSSTLSCISFSGLAYIVDSRRILMVTLTLPLVLMLLLYNIIPESPRWILLQSLPSSTSPKTSQSDEDESQTLLHRFVSETQSSHQKSLSIWSCGVQSNGRTCYGFLRRKKLCRIAVVVGLTWFAIGMLYRGINTSSIQLLGNFYSNYALRELVNLLAYAFAVILVTCAGRRITTFLGLIFSGVICVIFSFASDGFLLSEHGTVTLVVQLVGRFFVVLSTTSLTLYSVELFPTIIRCTALGLVTSTSFLGAALTPLIMSLQSINPTIPLAVLGCFSIIVAILLRIFLPETKGSLTAETLEDTVVGRQEPYNGAWSPKVNMTRTNSAEDNVDGERIKVSCQLTKPVDIDKNKDRFKDLGKSWEVSFDKASTTSRWEWLSYEDAKRKQQSLDIELSLRGESQLLDDQDREKLSPHVPGTSWILLYSTYEHGISLKTLYHRMEEVETPVLVAVKDSQEYVFGVFSPVPPQIQPGFYGYGKSFFFTSKPHFKIFPCSGKNEYYLSCDIDSLAFGCSDGLFGLWLDSDLYRGRSTACETYNSEVLASKEDFIILGLEIWTIV
ncbi:organic cation transporter protein-like [Actinia tenebrosa]|uniref:Oxidation resistance protein 1 n=1 Tax=Actinia tenebrosa TaxID=6105 RepID=A0A6P8J1E1_ACTTE|nr:organic cation transporter protein-like [Actinia tenebrosa]